MTFRAMRRGSGKTQGEIAAACGVTQAAVQQWESGRAMPAVDKLPALSAVLGVPVEALVEALTVGK